MSYLWQVLTRAMVDTWTLFVDTPIKTLVVLALCVAFGIWWDNGRKWRGVLTERVLHHLRTIRWPIYGAFVVFVFHIFVLTPKAMWKEQVSSANSMSNRAFVAERRLNSSQPKEQERSERGFEMALEENRKKTLADFAAMTTSQPAKRAALTIITQAPPPIPPVTPGFAFDATKEAVRKAREDEARKRMAAETLQAMQADENRIAAEEDAKRREEVAKIELNHRLKIFNYVVSKFLSNLTEIATAHGDSVRSDYDGQIKRFVVSDSYGGPARIQNFTNVSATASLAKNTNWSFDVSFCEVLQVDVLAITYPQNIRTLPNYSTSTPMAMRRPFPLGFHAPGGIGAEFSIFGSEAKCRLIGETQNAYANNTNATITNWQRQFEHLLTMFLVEVDERHPIK